MASAMHSLGLPLSPEGLGLLIFCLAGVATIVALARKELRTALRQREGLLDAAARLLGDPRVTIGSDGYPRLAGTWGGERVSMEVVADSLVPRRLPQLWLKLTMLSENAAPATSIGVLARPVGTEFYSRVLELPDSIAPTFGADFPLLMRGRNVSEAALQRTSGLFRSLFSDPTLKEVVITPRGAGMVRQIAEGDRGAHVLYRQIRFPVVQVSSELVRGALQELHLLNGILQASPVDAEVS